MSEGGDLGTKWTRFDQTKIKLNEDVFIIRYCIYLFSSANEGICLTIVQTGHPTAPSRLSTYKCMPYYFTSTVYIMFTFHIYTGHKHYTKWYLILLPYIFCYVSFFIQVHGFRSVPRIFWGEGAVITDLVGATPGYTLPTLSEIHQVTPLPHRHNT